MRKAIAFIAVSALLVGMCTIPINAGAECDSWLSFMTGGDRTSSSDCEINPTDPNFDLIWKQKAGHNITSSQPVIYDGKLFICTRPYSFDDDARDVKDVTFTAVDTSGLVCFDANTGEFLWENILSGWGSIATPSIDAERDAVIVGSSYKPYGKGIEAERSGIYSINCNHGHTNWDHQSSCGCYANGIICEDRYYLGTESNSGFICLDARKGRLIWSKYLNTYHLRNSPCIIDDKLFCYTFDGDVNALSTDGIIKWQNKDISAGLVYEITPSVWNGKLIVPSKNGNVHCLDTDGNELWVVHLMDIDGKIDEISSCAVHEGFIYTLVTDFNLDKRTNIKYLASTKLFCINPESEDPIEWERNIDLPIFDAPVGVGDYLLYSCMLRSIGPVTLGTPFVYVLDASDGSDVTMLDAGGRISTSPSVAGDKVYVGLASGEVACFGVYPISPTGIDFGECYLKTDKSKEIIVQNIFEGDESVSLEVFEKSDWFDIEEVTKDELARNERVTITVNTVPENIEELSHRYIDYINIKLGKDRYKVPVSLTTVYPDRIYLSPTDVTCQLGETIQFTARPMGSDNERLSGYNFEWDVSNGQVGIISNNGLFTPRAEGKTDVRAYVRPRPPEACELLGMTEVTVIKSKPPKVADLINFGKVNLQEINTVNLNIENCSGFTKTFYLTAYETWFRLDKTQIVVPKKSSETITLTLVNSAFKPGEKKIGDLKVAWSDDSKMISVIAQAQKDSEPPAISLDEIGDVIDKSSVKLNGVVSEKCELFVNGESFGSINKSFEMTLPLDKSPSKSDFIISAKDDMGNTSISEIAIINHHMLTIETTIGDNIMNADGELMELDVPPTIIEGRTMVPFRAIAEAFGASVGWDGNTKTVSMTLGDISIQLIIGNTTAIVSGISVEVDPPAQIVNGRTMVPLRFISESFGSNVEWNGETKTITITKLISP